MGTQQFCLKWNNHSSNMLNVFETLLTSEQLVDVTLACDGLSLKAHKMVLSACSPFFQSLFQENPCKHPIVILKDIRYTDLKAIIDFMYKGEVNVGQAHLSALLKTAETLKVKGLAEVSGEDGQSSSGSVVQQEVPVFPQAQHSSDVANIVQTIDNSIRPSSDSPTGRKRKRTKWKNRGQGNGNDSETDDQGPAAKNQEIVSADVIEDDSSSIGVVDGPSDTRNAKESRIIIEEATIVGDYVEPAALLEQNMTTDNVQPISSQLMLTNATSKDNEINVPENRSYDGTVATLTPETVDLIDRPEDVKPTALVSYEEPPMSPNATSSHHSQDDSNSMTMYMDPNSMPAIAGPSNYQQDKQPSASAGQETPKETEVGASKFANEKEEEEEEDDEEAYDSPYEDFYEDDDDDDEEDEDEDEDEDYEEFLDENVSKQSEMDVGIVEEIPSTKEGKENTSRDEEDSEELQNPDNLKPGVEYSFCRFCNAPFSLNTSRVRHERTIHLAQSFHICSECGYKSTRTDRHRRHMKDCHDIDIPLLRHTRTTNKPRPSQGQKSPSEDNIYQCYVCEKTFRARRSVLRHFREKHNNPDTFTCSFCGKSYTRKENLTKHMDSVHNVIV